MRLSHDKNGDSVTVKLSGELGHHEAREVSAYIDGIFDLYSISRLILDFSELSFMDSSGIAVVVQSFKKAKESDAEFAVNGIPGQAFKVLHAAGIDKIVKINRKDT